jgi:hypothetical protein
MADTNPTQRLVDEAAAAAREARDAAARAEKAAETMAAATDNDWDDADRSEVAGLIEAAVTAGTLPPEVKLALYTDGLAAAVSAILRVVARRRGGKRTIEL